jgi:small-conductance mechanosensitive channel
VDFINQMLGLEVSIPWANLLRAALLLITGIFAARLFRRVTGTVLGQLPGSQQRSVQRVTGWLILILFIAAALHQLGFKLGVLLGAAGVLSVAIGFASQTSASNLISGLFVLTERTIQPGDTIQVASFTGEVLSIDLLSTKMRTLDNLLVRIPNELLIKNTVVNMSRYPLRRFDLKLGLALDTDVARAREVLLAVAAANPLCLENPQPAVMQQGFGDSSIDIQLSVWAARENFGELRNTIQEEVKRALDSAGIAIAISRRALYLSGPLPEPRQPVAIEDAPGGASS